MIGSVRSSREYYLDLAANHDAIYVHAGGSNEAYVQIKGRGVDNLDGVNMYLPDTFYRDPERLKKYAYEHTLVTTGKGIVSGIKYRRYRTKISSGFKNPLKFCTPDLVMVISDENAAATNVIVPYNKNHHSQYVYDAGSMLYYRYQYGAPHLDFQTGTQLAFTNVLVLSVTSHVIEGDSAGRRAFDDVGSGTGILASRGTAIPVRWEKENYKAPLKLYTESGEPLTANVGKTFVSYVNGESNIVYGSN